MILSNYSCNGHKTANTKIKQRYEATYIINTFLTEFASTDLTEEPTVISTSIPEDITGNEI